MELTNIYCPYCGNKSQDIVTSQTEHLFDVECYHCGGFFDIKIGNPNEVFESDSVICDCCGIRERRIHTTVRDGKRYCNDCLPKEVGCKSIQCVNLVVDHSEEIAEDALKMATERAIVDVAPEHSFINLVKVHISDAVRADQANQLLKNIMKMFHEAGADNVVILPINKGIQNVTIERIEVEHR